MMPTRGLIVLCLLVVTAAISSETAWGNGLPAGRQGQPQEDESEGETDLTLSQWPPRRAAARRMDAHYILDVDDPHLKDLKTDKTITLDSEALYLLDPNQTSRVGNLTITGEDSRLAITKPRSRDEQDARFSGTNCVGLDDVMTSEIQALVKTCPPDPAHPGAKRFIWKINEDGSVECRTLVCGGPPPPGCQGTVPPDTIPCKDAGDPDDETNVPENTFFQRVDACTSAKCEYKGREAHCLGLETLPEGARRCKTLGDRLDEDRVPEGASFHPVSTCTTAKCEYTLSGTGECPPGSPPGTPGCPSESCATQPGAECTAPGQAVPAPAGCEGDTCQCTSACKLVCQPQDTCYVNLQCEGYAVGERCCIGDQVNPNYHSKVRLHTEWGAQDFIDKLVRRYDYPASDPGGHPWPEDVCRDEPGSQNGYTCIESTGCCPKQGRYATAWVECPLHPGGVTFDLKSACRFNNQPDPPSYPCSCSPPPACRDADGNLTNQCVAP